VSNLTIYISYAYKQNDSSNEKCKIINVKAVFIKWYGEVYMKNLKADKSDKTNLS